MVNIMKTTLDINKLENAICAYVNTTGNHPRYLICNEELVKLLSLYYDGTLADKKSINKYKGINIAICESLKQGEIDIV